MLDRAIVKSRVTERLISQAPDFTAPVLEVYELAKEYFGEDMVDLQKNDTKSGWRVWMDGYAWVNFLERIFRNPRNLDLHENLSNYHDNCWYDCFASEVELNSFLACMTPENLRMEFIPFYCILVHFHDIQITNEEDQSTLIEDIYAKVYVNVLGRHSSRMDWMRTTVSRLHYNAGYRHSHLPSVGQGTAPQWKQPCLGSGPIIMTMESLDADYNFDLWRLFWLELDQCIRVESLSGGPYMEMGNISDSLRVTEQYTGFATRESCNNMDSFTLSEVMRYMIRSKQLKFSYCGDKVRIANDFVDFMLIASNALLALYNDIHQEHAIEKLREDARANKMFQGTITANGVIQKLNHSTVSTEAIEQPTDLIFKGTPVMFRVPAGLTTDLTLYWLFNPIVAHYIYNELFILVNNVYGRQQHRNKK